jgi:hypothetical protein
MARMSVDDSFLRDPRVVVLAKLCRWTQDDEINLDVTRSRLLDVWAVCYDRITPNLGLAIVDVTARLSGFAAALVESELGILLPKGRIRICGVEERIVYLTKKAEAGRIGGVKSGETRRKNSEAKSKHSSKQIEAQLNLPDPVPDPVVVPDGDPLPAPDPPPPAPRISPGISPGTFPGNRPTLTLVDQLDERDQARRAIVSVIGTKHVEAFARVKHELKSQAIGPLPDDPFEQLRELVESMPSLDGVLERCEYALAIHEAEARKKKTLQYFGGSMWKRQTFEKALTFELADVQVIGAAEAAAHEHRRQETARRVKEIEARARTAVGSDDPEIRDMIASVLGNRSPEGG